GPDPGPARQVVERRPQRPGAELVRGLRGQPPLLGSLVPAARLRQRLRPPPPGAGRLIDVGGTERVKDRLPRLRVVVPAGPAVFRLGPGEPAMPLGAHDEPGPLDVR